MSNTNKSQTQTGNVINANMDKTITVMVERVVPHPLYGKYIKRSTKLLAHDENNQSKEGDVVLISSCRPISSRKVWRLEKVLTVAE
jgi:small subunit ribosomal protein S17